MDVYERVILWVWHFFSNVEKPTRVRPAGLREIYEKYAVASIADKGRATAKAMVHTKVIDQYRDKHTWNSYKLQHYDAIRKWEKANIDLVVQFLP